MICAMAFDVLFRQITPMGTMVGVGLPVNTEWDADTLVGVLTQLHPAEAAHARTLPVRRQITWIGGRLALRQALCAASWHGRDAILATSRGAPALPAGWRGSIAHKEAIAVAVAQSATALNVERAIARGQHGHAADILGCCTHLGIDVEVLSARRREHIAHHVLTPEEHGLWQQLPTEDARWRSLLLHFSLKEALYKALDPFVLRYVGFHEVALRVNADNNRHDGSADVALHLKHGEGPFRVQTQWHVMGDHMISLASVQGAEKQPEKID